LSGSFGAEVIALFFLGYVGLEIYVFLQAWDRFGFLNLMFAFALGAILGIGLVRNQGRYVLRKMQESLVRGQLPADEVLHGLLIFLGGLMLIAPGLISDAIGLLFIIPGPRHVIAFYLKPRLANKIKTGNFRVFSFGSMGGGGQRTGASPNGDGWARDVSPKVIDVKPISVESHEIADDGTKK
jgi:UPF0716 protein FxsA